MQTIIKTLRTERATVIEIGAIGRDREGVLAEARRIMDRVFMA
jgi:hypothetical protein